MSLDRIVRLAKKTGDTIIVHNPLDDHDVVLLDLDRYETLLDLAESVAAADGYDFAVGSPKVGESEGEEAGEEWWAPKGKGAASHEDEDPWTSAADVLGERFKNPDYFAYGDEGLTDLVQKEEEYLPEETEEEVPAVERFAPEEIPLPQPKKEDISEEPIREPIPPFNGVDQMAIGEEKPLEGEDPVFYEEPV